MGISTVASALLVVGLGSTPENTFQQIQRAHEGLKSGTFKYNRLFQGKNPPSTLFSFGPGRFSSRTFGPALNDLFTNDRTIQLKSGSIYLFDANTYEAVKYSPAKGTNLYDSISEAGVLKDEVIEVFMSPKGATEFLNSMRRYSGWKQEKGALSAKGSRNGKPYNIRLAYDSKYLLTRVEVKETGVVYGWQRVSGSFTAPTIPAAARNAQTISKIPGFAAGPYGARNTLKKMYMYYTRKQTGAVRVTLEKSNYTITWKPNYVRQVGPNLDWSYAGTMFTGKNLKTGKVKKGKIDTVPGVLETVQSDPVLPFTRSLLSGKLPIEPYTGDGMKAQVMGAMEVGGVAVTIVKLTGNGPSLSLFIAPNGALVRVENEYEMKKGSRITTTLEIKNLN